MASTIDRTIPATNSDLVSKEIRDNFGAAADDVEALQTGKEDVGTAASEVALHDASGAAHGGVESAFSAHQAASNPHSGSASDTDVTNAVNAHDASGTAHGGVESSFAAHEAAANPHSDSASDADVTSAVNAHDVSAAAHGGVEASFTTHAGAANPHSGSASSTDLTNSINAHNVSGAAHGGVEASFAAHEGAGGTARHPLATTGAGGEGFIRPLSGVLTEYLDGSGNWSTPAGGGGSGTYNLVRKNSGANISTDRARLNFIEGANVTIDVTDDGTDDETDITISAIGGGGGGYDTIQEDGTPLTQRDTLNFGAGLTASDNAGSTRTDVIVAEGEIAHQNLSGAGTNTHAQIDAHIGAGGTEHSLATTGAGGEGFLRALSGTVTEYLDGSGNWSTPAGGGGSPLTTKGDIYTRDVTQDARLPVGANGTILTANSATATGIEWQSPGGGGDVSRSGNGADNQIAIWDSWTGKQIEGAGVVIPAGGLLSYRNGVHEGIDAGSNDQAPLVSGAGSPLQFRELQTGGIADAAVTRAKEADMAANTIRLREATTGVPTDTEPSALPSLGSPAATDFIVGQKGVGGALGQFAGDDFLSPSLTNTIGTVGYQFTPLVDATTAAFTPAPSTRNEHVFTATTGTKDINAMTEVGRVCVSFDGGLTLSLNGAYEVVGTADATPGNKQRVYLEYFGTAGHMYATFVNGA